MQQIGVDLLDYPSRISLRKLYSLVYSLPPNAATWAKLSGDDRRWDDQTHLIANCQDILGMLYRVTWVGHQLRGKPPKFEPVDRPGQDEATDADLMDPTAIAFLNTFSPEGSSADVPPEVLRRMLAGKDRTQAR